MSISKSKRDNMHVKMHVKQADISHNKAIFKAFVFSFVMSRSQVRVPSQAP